MKMYSLVSLDRLVGFNIIKTGLKMETCKAIKLYYFIIKRLSNGLI